MSIIASELVAYGANHVYTPPRDDVTTVGGAIRVETGLLGDNEPAASPNDDISVVSTDGSDTTETTNFDYRGRTGALVNSGVVTMNGTTPVPMVSGGGPGPGCERILLIEYVHGGVDVGTITYTNTTNGVVGTMSPAILSQGSSWRLYRMFQSSYSLAASPVTFYDKMFWKNKNTTFAAIAPVYRLTADPQAMIQQGIHTSIDDSATIANRLTAPGGVSFVDDNVDQTGPDLAGGNTHAQGLWIQMTVPSGHAATKSTFTTQITAGTI